MLESPPFFYQFESKSTHNKDNYPPISNAVQNGTTSGISMRTYSDLCSTLFSRRSKNGCLTCKARKKKCDEKRPTCSDCKRLNKDCVWIDYDTMSKQEIRELKLKVEKEEGNNKLRKRKSKDYKESSADIYLRDINYQDDCADTVLKKARTADKVDLRGTCDSPIFNLSRQHGDALKIRHSPPLVVNSPLTPKPFEKVPQLSGMNQNEGGNFENTQCDDQVEISTRPKINVNDPIILSRELGDMFPLSIQSLPMDPLSQALQQYTRDRPGISRGHLADGTLPPEISFDTQRKSLSKLEEVPNGPYQGGILNRSLLEQIANGSQILLNETPRSPMGSPVSSFGEKSPFSSASFMNFLKDMSQYQYQRSQSEHKNNTDEEFETIILKNPSFNSLVETLNMDMSTENFINHIPEINALFTPPPQTQLNVIPELSNLKSSFLYSYYVDFLSNKVCIVPSSESNSYQRVFLPLACKDNGVLYSILAWSGFHLGGEWSIEGAKYMKLTLQHLNNSLAQETSDECNPRMGNAESERQSAIVKLATMLLVCSGEICKGDVKNWSMILSSGWKLLHSHGGILKFNRLKEEHWLISNFAYHDLLSSSTSSRGTYFPSSDYDHIFKDREGYSRGNLNPLLGISKNLYRIIGDINLLVFESNKALKVFSSEEHLSNYESDDDDVTYHGNVNKVLRTILSKAKNLEEEIENSKPESSDLVGMCDVDVELQLTLFEVFQLTAKLYLKQAVMKCNPTMLEVQLINSDLSNCLDVLLGTPVEASLVFPMFICGIHCATKEDRVASEKRLDNFIKSYGPWNLTRVKDLMLNVWERNPDGTKAVDWHSVLRELGWDINFA